MALLFLDDYAAFVDTYAQANAEWSDGVDESGMTGRERLAEIEKKLDHLDSQFFTLPFHDMLSTIAAQELRWKKATFAVFDRTNPDTDNAYARMQKEEALLNLLKLRRVRYERRLLGETMMLNPTVDDLDNVIAQENPTRIVGAVALRLTNAMVNMTEDIQALEVRVKLLEERHAMNLRYQ